MRAFSAAFTERLCLQPSICYRHCGQIGPGLIGLPSGPEVDPRPVQRETSETLNCTQGLGQCSSKCQFACGKKFSAKREAKMHSNVRELHVCAFARPSPLTAMVLVGTGRIRKFTHAASSLYRKNSLTKSPAFCVSRHCFWLHTSNIAPHKIAFGASAHVRAVAPCTSTTTFEK